MYEGQVTGACVSLYLSLTPVMVIEWVGDATKRAAAAMASRAQLTPNLSLCCWPFHIANPLPGVAISSRHRGAFLALSQSRARRGREAAAACTVRRDLW